MESQKRILVVEDDRVTQLLTKRFLEEQGYHITTTGDGGAVLRLVESEKPDLVLLDLGLEEGDPFGGASFDGFAVMEWLKRRTEHPVPVVVITGLKTPRLRERVLAAGAAAFFEKPVEKAKVLEAIRILVG
jgi:two-component system nitrogen regulation response regulator NtrX